MATQRRTRGGKGKKTMVPQNKVYELMDQFGTSNPKTLNKRLNAQGMYLSQRAKKALGQGKPPMNLK